MDAYKRKGPTLGAGDPAKARLQKLQRVLAFVGDLVSSLRAEFVPYRKAVGSAWAQPTSPIGGPQSPPAGAPILALITKLDQLQRQIDRGNELAAKAAALPSLEAQRLLVGFELQLESISAGGRSLEAEAQTARASLAAMGALERELRPAVRGTAPLSPNEQIERNHARMAGPGQRGTGLIQAIRRLAEASKAPEMVKKSGLLGSLGQTKATPPAPDPHAKARGAFLAAVKFVEEVLAYVSPRLLLVETAMGLSGLPAKARPWPEVMRDAPMAVVKAKIPPSDRNWVPSLAKLFLANSDATRRAHGALVQWAGAKLHMAEAQALKDQMDQAPIEMVGPLLSRANTPKLNAAAFPLSHLHISFQGLPQLSVLFPPPSGGGTKSLQPGGGGGGLGRLGTA